MSTLAEPTSPSLASASVSATPPAYSPADSPPSSPAFLLVEQNNHRQAGPIQGRVLIGRRPGNHIVIPDRSIARIHAWIIAADGRHILCDTGSRVGTLVNDRRITGRHVLESGDVIRIGPATIHYHTDPAAVTGAQPLDLTARPVATTRPEDGQFVNCACGAPLWIGWDFAGKLGQCRYCNQTVFVQTKLAMVGPGIQKPQAPPAVPATKPRATPRAYPPADSSPPAKKTATCGICQSAILPGELDHTCPSCAIPFHADCWSENRGCSSYGCPQVNVLDLGNDKEPPQSGGLTDDLPADHDVPAPAPLPWEFLILAGAVLGSIAGAWTFGVPPLAAAVAAALGLRKRSRHRAVLYVALPFAALGCVAGIGISYFWWFTTRLHR